MFKDLLVALKCENISLVLLDLSAVFVARDCILMERLENVLDLDTFSRGYAIFVDQWSPILVLESYHPVIC